MVELSESPRAQSRADLTAEQVLTTTRAVRKRLDLHREVPSDLIEDCARIALQAPIACNGYYPHFVVVSDAARKRALADLYRISAEAFLARDEIQNLRFDDPIHDAQQPRVISSAWYLAEHLAEVPVLVIPCMSPRIDVQRGTAQAGLWGSVLPQAWSFMLAARARGLASTWTTLHLEFEEQVATLLGIDYSSVQQAALLAVAYPLGQDFKPAYREPIQKFMHWNHW